VSKKLTNSERFVTALALLNTLAWEREANNIGSSVKDRRCPRAYGRSDLA